MRFWKDNWEPPLILSYFNPFLLYSIWSTAPLLSTRVKNQRSKSLFFILLYFIWIWHFSYFDLDFELILLEHVRQRGRVLAMLPHPWLGGVWQNIWRIFWDDATSSFFWGPNIYKYKAEIACEMLLTILCRIEILLYDQINLKL